MKRHLSKDEIADLRQALHVATLDALMASRRWKFGDLVFQGETSLYLAHGSPRISEDLDFLVNSSLNLESISDSVQRLLASTGPGSWLPEGTGFSVSKAKDGRNPHAFVVTISGANVIGSVKVKVELWQTNAISSIAAVVGKVRLARGPLSGMQTQVPTATLAEIYADKVFALAARPYLKPRDVFDLHWLVKSQGFSHCSDAALRVRLATYPNQTPAAWLEKAKLRRVELKESGDKIAHDLKRWLPSSWPLNATSVAEMIKVSVSVLEQGMEIMRVIEADMDKRTALEKAIAGPLAEEPDPHSRLCV